MLDSATRSSVDYWLRPRYNGEGIVNLMASISAGMGVVQGQYAPSPLLPSRLVAQARHVVLMVIDGLGYQYLRQQQPQSKLARHVAGPLTSVFPSTTATAITTLVTGVAPQQHGVTGWYTYLPHVDRVCAVLPFCMRGSGAGLDAQASAGMLYAPPLFEKFAAHSVVIMPDNIVDSPFTRMTAGSATRKGFQQLSGYAQRIAETILHSDRRTFVYAYWPQLDSLSHQYGATSAQVDAHFREIDAMFARLTQELLGTDTLLLLTADHGLTDTAENRQLTLNDHPELLAMLRQPLSGEPRAAYCHVVPGMRNKFKEYVEKNLRESVALYHSRVLLEQGYFGRGPTHAEFLQRIGDYVMLMRDNWVVKDYMATEKPFSQIGVHGGLTATELLVPLIKVRL